MGDRYGGRYGRPQSPVMYDPARTSLPTNMYASPVHEHHTYNLPSSRREVNINPRSSVSSIGSAGPVTTTTYKVTDPRASTRDSNRSRSSTLDSLSRPFVVTSALKPHYRPVVHRATGGRPASPLLKNPYRSSDEEYYTVPATSHHDGNHYHQHHKRYSATMDNADMHKVATERDSGRLRVDVGREKTYRNTPGRTIYSGSAVRHADTVAADYGDNGYGYTNPRDLVQYDLNNPTAPRHHPRRESYEGGRAPRPSSSSSSQDIAGPRVPYDARERGPPPSTRGFDRIQPRNGGWEQPAGGRVPAVPPPPPVEPIQRPARVDPPFQAEPPRRVGSLTRRHDRPVSYHHDPRREPRRDEYYESTDESRRERQRRHDRYDDSAEHRGYPPRSERPDRVERADRGERSDRSPDDWDKKERKGGKEALATGLSIAGAALGVNTLKKVRSHDDRDEREDRDERRKRRDDDEYDDEPRRYREARDERPPVDLSNRDPRERRHRDSDLRPPPPGSPGYDRDVKPEAPIIDLSGRDPKERHNSREERPRDGRPRDDRSRDERPREIREERDRDSDPDRRDRDRDRARRHRSESSVAAAATAAAVAATAIDSREESSGSDDALPRSHRENRSRSGHGAVPAFNPKDTMDLKALKDALNKNEASAPKEPIPAQRTPRESVSKEARELADIRSDLNSSTPRGREPSLAVATNKDNRQLRVVSPPRDTAEDKPVKSILRPPREKFPEDPSPIREGVAPLKDAKKDGVPPDARWTKISRKLVNPAALEAGKERFEERDDFVIVLRVLSRDEVQGYAEVTERIRAAREEMERQARRRARRERHERHKLERSARGDREPSHGERSERRHNKKARDRDTESESDTTEDSYERDRPKMIEPAAKPIMSGGLGEMPGVGNSLREIPGTSGQYTGYTRSPPPPSQGGGTSIAATAGTGRKEEK